jgi:hypothetical protein
MTCRSRERDRKGRRREEGARRKGHDCEKDSRVRSRGFRGGSDSFGETTHLLKRCCRRDLGQN